MGNEPREAWTRGAETVAVRGAIPPAHWERSASRRQGKRAGQYRKIDSVDGVAAVREARHMPVNRARLLQNMNSMRHQFALSGLDVRPYSNTAIADAICASWPEGSSDYWPTDAQLRAAFDHLARQGLGP